MPCWQLFSQETRSHLTKNQLQNDDSLLKPYIVQGDASIEEWELFADPRELERRKAERRRAALPPEVRVFYMSTNLERQAFIDLLIW